MIREILMYALAAVAGLLALMLLAVLLTVMFWDWLYELRERGARDRGWADRKAERDWRADYEKRYAKLRAEARDA